MAKQPTQGISSLRNSAPQKKHETAVRYSGAISDPESKYITRHMNHILIQSKVPYDLTRIIETGGVIHTQ